MIALSREARSPDQSPAGAGARIFPAAEGLLPETGADPVGDSCSLPDGLAPPVLLPGREGRLRHTVTATRSVAVDGDDSPACLPERTHLPRHRQELPGKQPACRRDTRVSGGKCRGDGSRARRETAVQPGREERPCRG